MGLRDYTLFDVIRRNARIRPDRTAFVADGARITHAAYLRRVEQTAAALASLGVHFGDRVAVIADNSAAFADLFGAAARLGIILVPINIRLSAEEVASMLADARPVVVLLDAKYLPLVQGCMGLIGGVKHWLHLGRSTEPSRSFEALLRDQSIAPAADVGMATPYAMIYTAAVGGQPRGAVVSHGNLIASATQLALEWRLGADDVNLGLLPLFHVAGLGLMLSLQHAGGATVLMPKFDADLALRHIAVEKVTVFASFAPILNTMLEAAAKSETVDLSSVRAVTGLESPEAIARLETMCANARFWATYGQTELSGLATIAPYRDRPGSAGRPILLNEVAIVDDVDRPVPTGQVGDVVVRGPCVFQGYWNREADNAATFRNGWHHTGDMGRLDEDGYLWYAHRSPAKDLIKPGGENVYPAEVEQAIREHAAIAEAVVIGVPDPTWGEAVKAVCVLEPGALATPEEIIDFVGARIARYKRPRHVVFVAELPKTAAGAIDRMKVKEAHGQA